MGKRSILIGFMLLFITGLATTAHCDDAFKKLGRGVCNAVTFPFEIPEQITRTNNSDGPTAAMTYGVVKGLSMMCLRAVVGIYEIVTFPIPLPKEYEPILTDPEFFLEEKSW